MLNAHTVIDANTRGACRPYSLRHAREGQMNMKKYRFEEFAKRLRHLAGLKGITQPAELARITGLNRITCGTYMRGDRAASLEACVQITDAIGGDARWLHSAEQETMLRGGQRLERHAAFNAPIYKLKDNAPNKEKDIARTIDDLIVDLINLKKRIAA